MSRCNTASASGAPVDVAEPRDTEPGSTQIQVRERAHLRASIYRAIAENEKRQSYPEAVDQAQADFASLQTSD